MKISTKLLLFLLIFATSAATAADPAGEAYEAARASYKSLKAMPEADLKFRHHWQRTINKFEAVAAKHPKSWVADDALYMVGTLYYELYDRSRFRSDLDKAVTAFKDCAARFPDSNYADDCLYWEAKALHVLDRHEPETKVLQTLLEKYPKGDMAKEARALVAKLDASTHKIGAIAEATPKPKATATPQQAVAVDTPKLRSGGETSSESQAVSKVSVWSNDGYTRVGIYLGGKARWTVNDLKADGDKPPRVYVDITKAHVGDSLKQNVPKLGSDWEVPIEDGLLQRARVNQFSPETVRVVLDVASMERYEVLQLDDPFRILIDVTGVGQAPEATVAVANVSPLPVATGTPLPPEELERRFKELEKRKVGLTLAQQLGLKATRIYVDAGHGGHDPGAIGPTGLREKDVTLAIAKRVRDKLVALGYDALLTRKDDTFLELEERTGIANGGKGDLFVSIHCNSTDPKSKSNPSGVETYFANLPTDAAAARLSALENATTTETMSGLEAVLLHLARNEFTNHSAELAGHVQRSVAGQALKHNPQSRDYGVKSALFYVLLTARMPAILVETAFISNAKDEKRLRDPKYLDAIADSIAQGIETYLDANAMKPAVAVPKPAQKPAADDTPVKIASEPEKAAKER